MGSAKKDCDLVSSSSRSAQSKKTSSHFFLNTRDTDDKLKHK